MLLERTVSWNEIGTEVTGTNRNVEDILSQANLDYSVEKTDIFTKIGNYDVKIDGKQAVVRNDGKIYGVVSDKYTPIQNVDAFDFIKNIDENIEFVKAGETKAGLIYLIGKLQEKKILGDEFTPYVIFQNGHNGLYSLKMAICPLRIVCQNQFNMAFKESNSTFNIKHSRNIESKVRTAAESLAQFNHYMTVFEQKAEKFALQGVNEERLQMFLNFMFPVDENATDRIKRNVEESKHDFLQAYNSDDNSNFRGTAWGLLNGLTDYITHSTYKRKVDDVGEKKFIDTIVDAKMLNNATNYINQMLVC